MKVLELGKFFAPARGGIESHLETLARELALQVDVSIVVSKDRWSLTGSRETWNGIVLHRLGCQARPFSAPVSAGLPLLLRRLNPAVVHLHMPNPYAAAACLTLPAPRRLVVSWHSDVVRQKRLERVMRPITRRLLRGAHRVLVASNRLLDASGSLAEVRSKCTVIPYGIDTSAFELTDAGRSRLGALQRAVKRPYVLFVGRLVYYKGLEVLIEAVSGLDAALVVIGSGPLDERYRGAAGRSAAAGRIHFLGDADPATTVAAYHGCDVFCLPSIEPSEAFGIVQLEAMACGKPVVSTDLPTGVTEVNEHGVTGLVVPPRDAGATREALAGLLRDPALRAAMGERGRSRVRDRFSASLMARRILAVLEEAARG